jgi:ketosteroid isomerase-like protein
METEETRKLIEDYYAAAAVGDRDKLSTLLTEDVEWRPAETVPAKPLQGRRVVSSVVSGRGREQMFDMDTFTLTVRKKTVDGDTAVVQQAISAQTRDGKRYDNEYCWIYTCRDGQIASIVEYVDTWKAAQVFGWT